MNSVDLTPTFALRRLAILFEGGKMSECAALVRQLTAIRLESILRQLPVDALHHALPSSLPVLEALYLKVSQRHPGHLPLDLLHTDHLVQRLLALFAKHPIAGCGGSDLGHSGGRVDTSWDLHLSCCRSILRDILQTEPGFIRSLQLRKRVLDRCLRRMGQQGSVSGPGGRLTSLDEALREELERHVTILRTGLHKLEQLQLAPAGGRAHAPGPQLAEISHQRLMQMSRDDVQERLIRNKTMLTGLEPAAVHRGRALQRLLRTLRERVEADKLLLFYHTELRKMGSCTAWAKLAAMEEPAQTASRGGGCSSGSAGAGHADSRLAAGGTHEPLATILRQFSQSFATVISLAKATWGQDDVRAGQDDVTAGQDADDQTDHSDTTTSSSEGGEGGCRKGEEEEEGGEGRAGRICWVSQGVSPWATAGSTDGGGGAGSTGCLTLDSARTLVKKMKVVSLSRILPTPSVHPHLQSHHHHLRLSRRHQEEPPATVTAGRFPADVSGGRLNNNGWLRVGGAEPYLQQTTPKRSGGRVKGREAGTETSRLTMDKTEDLSDNSTVLHSLPRAFPATLTASESCDKKDEDYWTTGSHPLAPSYATETLPAMEEEILHLRQELFAAREQIQRLQQEEKQLRERLHGQAHQNFQTGKGQFEDVSLGTHRPAELIRRYGELYTDGRVEALDALDRLEPLKGLDVLKLKLLFSVVVLAFKSAQQSVGELWRRLRRLLDLPLPGGEERSISRREQQHQPRHTLPAVDDGASAVHAAAAAHLEHHVTSYLCKTVGSFDVAEIVDEVCQQIYMTLYDYPCLKSCDGLVQYAASCVRIAWGLSVQPCPYTITYQAQTFDHRVHERFHTSDPDKPEITNYLWPALADAQGTCVSKAVVIT